MTLYYQDDYVTLYHGDCLEVLPSLSGVTALVTDPPYGIGYKPTSTRTKRSTTKDWDRIQGDERPFDPSHLLNYPKVVLFGANHYADRLPSSPGWLVWDKLNGLDSKREIGFNDSADVEMAWTNSPKPARIFSHRWMGLLRDSELHHKSLHPTQKPVVLMRWVLTATTGKDDLICDPYAGSGSTLVAAKDLGRKAIGIEIDEKYCETVAKRCAQDLLELEWTA
jgi:hypothetical protein